MPVVPSMAADCRVGSILSEAAPQFGDGIELDTGSLRVSLTHCAICRQFCVGWPLTYDESDIVFERLLTLYA